MLGALRTIARDLDGAVLESSAAEQELQVERWPGSPTTFRRCRTSASSIPPSGPIPTPRKVTCVGFLPGLSIRQPRYVPLVDALTELQAGRELVSATFVIPHPPGFPVLVPGQVISPEIVEFLSRIDIERSTATAPSWVSPSSVPRRWPAAGRFAVAED